MCYYVFYYLGYFKKTWRKIDCRALLPSFHCPVHLPDFSPSGALPKTVSLGSGSSDSGSESSAAVTPYTPSKIILTGEKKKTFHREELTASNTERALKTRTEHHAAIMQKKKSGASVNKGAESSNRLPKQLVNYHGQNNMFCLLFKVYITPKNYFLFRSYLT